ncbi:transposase [Tenacibaculum piscium]|uniref:transposase n=1 Tax=Tenacibaculum piscium TaxID=1458515 RepID=UPI001F21EF1F|nr:transposase [Tenacibaculum piscium]
MTKIKGKYRIESNRLKGWDYGSNAIYFVTICCKNKECFFGDIINGKIILSEIGKIVETQWIKTFEMRPDMNLQTGEYIVMPNHFHAIITIGENSYNTTRRDAMHCVSTTTKKCIANPSNKFGSQSKNLASIIRGFKTGVTVNALKTTVNFSWQPNYHDHIIRNNKAYHNISDYIINNPSKWNEDTFY